MHGLDEAFDSFMAATLDFPHDFTSNVDGPRYSSALQQIRLGIKQGGYGLTSAALIVPAALYAAICAFTKWLHEESHLPLRDLDWLSDHASRHLLIFRHIHVSMDSALAVLEQRWGFESTAACPVWIPPHGQFQTSTESSTGLRSYSLDSIIWFHS